MSAPTPDQEARAIGRARAQPPAGELILRTYRQPDDTWTWSVSEDDPPHALVCESSLSYTSSVAAKQAAHRVACMIYDVVEVDLLAADRAAQFAHPDADDAEVDTEIEIEIDSDGNPVPVPVPVPAPRAIPTAQRWSRQPGEDRGPPEPPGVADR